MADASFLYSKLKEDLPFSYPHPDKRTRGLLVETSSVKKFKDELWKRYKTFMRNSGITDILGRARSGKTHLIMNLEYLTNEKGEHKGLVIILPLSGEDISLSSILDYMVKSDIFAKKALELGIKIEPQENNQGKIKLIESLIMKLREKEGSDVGILFALDNIDEHIRQRRKKVSDLKQDLEQFLGVLRLLIEKIDEGLAIVLILTPDAYESLKYALADPTLAGRVEIICDPTDPGKVLSLGGLSEDEAFLLVSQYMKDWASRKEISLPEFDECTAKGRNIFPFTQEAIVLLWKAAQGWAGLICKGCRDALVRKETPKTIEELKITKKDMVDAISASAMMYPNFPSLKNEISVLINGPQIETEIKNWIETTAKIKYSGELPKDIFKRAFCDYIITLSQANEEDVKIETDITINGSNSEEYHKLDIRIDAYDKKTGVVFVPNPIVDCESGKGLAKALEYGVVHRGIFICAGKEPERDYKGKKKEGLSHEFVKELKDYVARLDYNPSTTVVVIPELDAWGIVKGNEITDRNRKVTVLSWIESRIKFFNRLKTLASAEPRKMPPPPPLSPRDLPKWP